MKHSLRFLTLITLVLLSGCASPAMPATDAVAPVCFAASYEAGGDRVACGDSSTNPIVVECDRPADIATIRQYVGTSLNCVPGAVVDSWCCADPVTLSESFKCDQQAAVEAFRTAHDELGKVGEWVVSPDCIVTQVLPAVTN